MTENSRFGPPDEGEADALVRATIRVIERTGSAAPAVQDILGEAMLSTPALYRNFESKNALLLRVHFEAVTRLVERIEVAIDKCETSTKAVECYVQTLLRQASRRGVTEARSFILASTSFLEEYPIEQRALHGALAAPLRRVLERGVELGALSSSYPARDAAAICDYVNASVRRHLAEGTSASREEAKHLVEFALRALRP